MHNEEEEEEEENFNKRKSTIFPYSEGINWPCSLLIFASIFNWFIEIKLLQLYSTKC